MPKPVLQPLSSLIQISAQPKFHQKHPGKICTKQLAKSLDSVAFLFFLFFFFPFSNIIKKQGQFIEQISFKHSILSDYNALWSVWQAGVGRGEPY